MRVRVRLFAASRELCGTGAIDLDLVDGATIADLREALAANAPPLSKIMPQLLFAVGTRYADDKTPLVAGAEVACIPPVSGG